ncbi:unnamed protein product [Larinioides sclopetarius]|uniref:Uncharacterized protein n=3 Tax=Larinioides sclopetarius TaxID=280406 RepID=A0AAV2AT64_9ARAC
MRILAPKSVVPDLEKVKVLFSKYWGMKHAMYNFKSTLIILLLGVILLVPTAYCFTLFGPSLDSNKKVDEEQNDAPQTTIIDVVPPIAVSDTTKDTWMNDDDTMEDFTIDDDVTMEDSTTDDDDTSEDSSIDNDDTAKDPSTNDNEPSRNSWPVIMIMEDNSALVNTKSKSGLRRMDSSNNWMVINKRTRTRKVEEERHDFDFGKKRRVINEDKNVELRIYRDDFHTVIRNGIDLTNMFRL